MGNNRVYSYKILQDVDLSNNEIKRVSKIKGSDNKGSENLSIDAQNIIEETSESHYINGRVNVNINSPLVSIQNLANPSESVNISAKKYENTSGDILLKNDNIADSIVTIETKEFKVDSPTVTVGSTSTSTSTSLDITAAGISIKSSDHDTQGSKIHSDVAEFERLHIFGEDSPKLEIKFDTGTKSLVFSTI